MYGNTRLNLYYLQLFRYIISILETYLQYLNEENLLNKTINVANKKFTPVE